MKKIETSSQTVLAVILLELHNMVCAVRSPKLSYYEFLVLEFITWWDAGCRQKFVQKFFQIKPSTIDLFMQKLEKEGYVRLETDPDDMRQKIVRLTDHGEEALKRFHGTVQFKLEQYVPKNNMEKFMEAVQPEAAKLVDLLDKPIMDVGFLIS